MENLFWDSNVFIAFINNENSAYDVDSIRQFLEECQGKSKKYHIYASAMSLAEVTPAKMKSEKYHEFQDFINDFEGVIDLISPDPNIIKLAGHLKDKKYKKGLSERRMMTMGDAIIVATAVELEDTFNVPITHFHTFDDGKGKIGPEGSKGVSLLNLVEWCDGLEGDPHISRVLELDICRPDHPEKRWT